RHDAAGIGPGPFASGWGYNRSRIDRAAPVGLVANAYRGTLAAGAAARPPASRARRAGAPDPSDRVLQGLQGDDLDDVAGRLGLDRHRLAGEGIAALLRLGRGLADDLDLGHVRQQRDARTLLA